MKKIKEILKKPPIKNVLMGLLTIIIGAICSSLGSWDKIDKVFWIKVAVVSALTLLYALLLIFYSTSEVNERRIKAILESEVKAFESIMIGIVSICKQSSSDVTTIIRKMIIEKNIDLNIWNFDKACTWVCSQVYNLLGELSCGNKDFGVAYIKLEDTTKPETEIKMNSFANKNMHKPSIYGKRRKIDIDDVSNYHDVDLFRLGKAEIDVIIGQDEINEVFSYESKYSRMKNKGKYNQYIAIPVICDDTKMIGLLEIVCLNNATLGDNKQEVLELASRYFVPYSYLILLLYKLEKALLAKPI